MIRFRLDMRSGVPPYLQVVQQVTHALRMGVLEVGDQLPTVKEVAASLAINPNTVLKAYREARTRRLGRRKAGRRHLRDPASAGSAPDAHLSLARSLNRWVDKARAAGLDDQSIEGLVRAALGLAD